MSFDGAGVTVITSSSRRKRELVTVRIDLRIRWAQFCRRVDGIGHFLFSIRFFLPIGGGLHCRSIGTTADSLMNASREECGSWGGF